MRVALQDSVEAFSGPDVVNSSGGAASRNFGCARTRQVGRAMAKYTPIALQRPHTVCWS